MASSQDLEVKIAGISSVESLEGALVGSSPVVIAGISSVESSSVASIFLSEVFPIVLERASVRITLMLIKLIEISNNIFGRLNLFSNSSIISFARKSLDLICKSFHRFPYSGINSPIIQPKYDYLMLQYRTGCLIKSDIEKLARATCLRCHGTKCPLLTAFFLSLLPAYF